MSARLRVQRRFDNTRYAPLLLYVLLRYVYGVTCFTGNALVYSRRGASRRHDAGAVREVMRDDALQVEKAHA